MYIYTFTFCSTLGKAWQVLKAELYHRSKAHSDFAAQVDEYISVFFGIGCMYNAFRC